MADKSLLLLEDDQNLSDTICDYLEEHGYSVTPVYDGEEAEEKLYERRYDLLLLDVNVPGFDGFELLYSGDLYHRPAERRRSGRGLSQWRR